MAAGSAARRYAEALLDVASEEHAVPGYRRELDKLAAAFGPEAIRGPTDAPWDFDFFDYRALPSNSFA